mmetsp:Transcript_16126/g.24665  ORF Transcript_16126/g.24665 Transcript_16126/m.24665 type:complete len:1300 (+) Transcript_16126:142-4041(+)
MSSRHSIGPMSSQRNKATSEQNVRGTKTVRKPAVVNGTVPYLTYSSDVLDPSASLSSLTDNKSNYSSVARSCLQLNQHAGTSGQLQHDGLHSKMISSIFAALFECLASHTDRRSRILAAKTLALCARAAYAKSRHSPLLFSVRDGTLHRLEDEIGTDVPVALCTSALEDVDDGVAVSSVEALGILTLSSAARAGTTVDDELTREIQAIAACRQNPFAPCLSDCSDEDPSVPQMELASRVYENVLVPRIWRLVHRVLFIKSPDLILKALPFLTSCLVYLIKLMPSTTFGMDRNTYAKRWIEVDVVGLVNLLVTRMIIPAISRGSSSICHALCGLRLAHVCLSAPWAIRLCNAAVHLFILELSSPLLVLEQTQSLIAALIIAMRAIPLAERPLEAVVAYIRRLPATTIIPSSVTSPTIQSGKYQHRSTRIGLLTEVAVSLIVDGHSEGMRVKVAKSFLSGEEVTALLNSRRSKGNSREEIADEKETLAETDIAEEFVLALCKVTFNVGKEVMKSGYNNSHSAVEWIHFALTVLSSNCAGCLNWKPQSNIDPLATMGTACQAAYIELLAETMYAVGCLCPRSSVTLNLLPLVSPTLMLEDLSYGIAALAQSTKSMPLLSQIQGIQENVSSLVDQFLEYKCREGIPLRHIRIAVIAILSDHWVNSLTGVGSSAGEENSQLNIREINARELLIMLSEEVCSLTRELSEGTGDRDTNLKYLDICVASVENIALMACDCARRNDASSRRGSSEDIDEDVIFLVSSATAALEGKNLRESYASDSDLDGPSASLSCPYPMLATCSEAVRRIQSVTIEGQEGAFEKYGIKPSVTSMLIKGANSGQELKSGDVAGSVRSPLVSDGFENGIKAPLAGGDAYFYALFLQYSLQVINTRIDVSLQTSAFINPDQGGKKLSEAKHSLCRLVRTPNYLRLSTLPAARSAGVPRSLCTRSTGFVKTLSGASDPINLIIAYSMRRCLRYDCELEYKLFVTCRVHNVTPVSIVSGLRMDLRIAQQGNALEGKFWEGSEQPVFASHTAVFKHEIKSGEFVTWEVALTNWPKRGTVELHPSVTFREIDAEHVPLKLAVLVPVKDGENIDSDENRYNDEEERTHADDITTDDAFSVDEDGGDDEKTDITLAGEPLQLSPMVGIQPCPLVFFRNRKGDVNAFRVMWHQMQYQMPKITLYANPVEEQMVGSSTDEFGVAVANLSCLAIDEERLSSATTVRGWAFQTLTNNANLLCLMVIEGRDATGNDEYGSQQSTLHFRADDEALLLSVLGSNITRDAVVASLTGNKWMCKDGQANGYFEDD